MNAAVALFFFLGQETSDLPPPPPAPSTLEVERFTLRLACRRDAMLVVSRRHRSTCEITRHLSVTKDI